MAAIGGSLPAWSALGGVSELALPMRWPHPVTREWAWGDSSGRGVRVCVVDSGIEAGHPRVGDVDGAFVTEVDAGGSVRVVADAGGDVAGHGTACGGIVRSLARDCGLYSVRVLGEDATGTGAALIAGLTWAVQQDFDVINLSMSTRRREFLDALHEISDAAYFQRTVVVASAHNMAVQSFPWRFASVVSVGCHGADDPLDFRYNPRPPAEFFARGADVEVAWLGGGTTVATGNSFAAAHMAGICALLLAQHPGLTPFEVKSLLYLTASNVESEAA
jgi:subtilisin